jgi:hypothetical protein
MPFSSFPDKYFGMEKNPKRVAYCPKIHLAAISIAFCLSGYCHMKGTTILD